MAGISAQACISLILQHIGGIPLIGAMKTSVEGCPPARQILGAGAFSLPALSMVQAAIGGAGIGSMLGTVFQNPLAAISSNLTSSLSGTFNGLESSFVEISEDLTRSIKPEFINKISLTQVDSLKLNIAGLSDSMPTFTDLTNKISGVALPTFDQAGDFGLQQVAAVTSSFDSLANNIPTELDLQTGGLKAAIGGHLDNIIAPLNTLPQLTDINSVVSNLVANISNAQSPASASSIITSALSNVSGTKSFIDGTVLTSKSTMNTFMNASQAISQASVVNSALQGDSTRSQNFITQITKPTALTQIRAGIELQKKYLG